MDLKRFHTFVTVTEFGSISAAARKPRLTQPALSRQPRDPQAEFGLRLFDQGGRRLALSTDRGEA
jgi:DNA-binding transcriptional LysR family regulator